MTPGVLLNMASVAAVTKEMKTALSCPVPWTLHMGLTQTALFTGRQVSLHDLRSPMRFQERLSHSQSLHCCLLTNQPLNNLIVCFQNNSP